MRKLGASVLIALATATLMAAPLKGPRHPLDIDIRDTPGNNGTVEVTITNTDNHAVRLPRWWLPAAYMDARLFQVSLDGVEAPYLGRIVEHAAPHPRDLIALRPGETIRTIVDLAQAYDMSAPGEYSVRFESPLHYATGADAKSSPRADAITLASTTVPLRFWVDDTRTLTSPLEAQLLAQPMAVATQAGVVYGACTSSQIDSISPSFEPARAYANDADTYMQTGIYLLRYTRWFGLVTTARANSVKAGFASVAANMDSLRLACVCPGGSSSTIAFVYPSDTTHTIYLCPAYFNLPITGNTSKADTLVHEMSHFNDTAMTYDFVYGIFGSTQLALLQPNQAVKNADNYAFFSANSPPLP